MATALNPGHSGAFQYGICSTIEQSSRLFSGGGARAAFQKGTRWDLKSTVVIRFLDGNPALYDLVKKHAEEWAELTKLTFNYLKPEDNQPSDVRVAFTGAFGINPEEFSSLIGIQARQVNNQFTPTMKLGFTQRVLNDERDTRRLILHEFGHMMGLIHEHQNPTSNNRFIFDRNGLNGEMGRLHWTPQMVEDNIIKRFDPSQFEATQFDEFSVMTYALDGRFVTPATHVNYDLSDTDKELIKRIYEITTPPPPILVKDRKAMPGIPIEIGTPSEAEFYQPIFPIMFQFKVDKEADYVMQTDSAQPWIMELLGPDDPEKLIDKDDKSSGPGPNALLRAKLEPGTYFLRIIGRIVDNSGSFKVKVDPA